MNKTFGIRFDGLQEPIEQLVKQYIQTSKYQDFKYVEVGAGSCVTMRAIYDIVKENIKHDNWKIIGLELCDGWSLDWNEVNKSFSKEELGIINNRQSETPQIKNAELWLDKNPRELITQSCYSLNGIDICLIDASHGYKSVQADFLAIKDKIKVDGILLFHDFCVLSQQTDWQTVDNDFINVRKALNDLSLMDGKYPNWAFKGEILGSRFQGKDGNGIGVFQKL